MKAIKVYCDVNVEDVAVFKFTTKGGGVVNASKLGREEKTNRPVGNTMSYAIVDADTCAFGI
jgi:hypothetical protein